VRPPAAADTDVHFDVTQDEMEEQTMNRQPR
jgi:hypothetical protein